MKISVLEPVAYNVTAIKCVLPVRYDEEDIPNDFPGREGDTLTLTIDIDTGVIRDWPQGRADECHMKVVDAGCYYLIGTGGGIIAERQDDYVPDCIPGEYGDYVDFQIDATGKIVNWKATPDTVTEAFFPESE